jgi:hypothetical protein
MKQFIIFTIIFVIVSNSLAKDIVVFKTKDSTPIKTSTINTIIKTADEQLN